MDMEDSIRSKIRKREHKCLKNKKYIPIIETGNIWEDMTERFGAPPQPKMFFGSMIPPSTYLPSQVPHFLEKPENPQYGGSHFQAMGPMLPSYGMPPFMPYFYGKTWEKLVEARIGNDMYQRTNLEGQGLGRRGGRPYYWNRYGPNRRGGRRRENYQGYEAHKEEEAGGELEKPENPETQPENQLNLDQENFPDISKTI